MKVNAIKLKDIGVCDNTRANDSEGIAPLMSSIKKDGLMAPIVVCPNFTGSKLKTKFVLVSGHRRMNAVRKLGKKEIPAVVNTKVGTKKDLIIHNLSENIHKKSVTPLEEGRFFKYLMDEEEMTHKEIAIRMSIAPTHVRNAMKAYNEVPDTYRAAITRAEQGKTPKNKISLTCASEILTLKKTFRLNKRQTEALFKAAADKGLSRTQMRVFADNYDKTKTAMQNIKKLTAKDSREMEKITFVRCDVMVDRKQMAKLQKKYGGIAAYDVVKGILYGTITDRLVKP